METKTKTQLKKKVMLLEVVLATALEIITIKNKIMEKGTKTKLEEIVKNSQSSLKWADVTLDPTGYPRSVGELRALIGFNDQRDAEYFAELTDGEFCQFFQKDGWQLLYPSVRHAHKKTVSQLAHPYPTIFLNGNEDYYELCEKVYGIPLIEYIQNIVGDDISEEWIKVAIDCFEHNTFYYPEDITEEQEDMFDDVRKKVEDIMDMFYVNYKGHKGYVVIDDVNNCVEGTYNTEYPAHYREDNKNYIYGVLYNLEKESEIIELLEEL